MMGETYENCRQAREFMLTGIDHIVVIAPDLQTAIDEYTQLGFTVVPGGRHNTGTHNALIGLADGSYIELIAFYEPTPTHRWHSALQRGGGLIDFCAVSTNLDEDIATFRQAGIAMSDRTPMSRVRPDGYKLDWVLSTPSDDLVGTVPFLIEDITPREERVPKQTTHPNGVIGIDTLTIPASDLSRIESWYRQILHGPIGKLSPHMVEFGTDYHATLKAAGNPRQLNSYFSTSPS
jgi:catechol 2,3-dioxygenase-like lactoylglutathione lyase family enzyme